MPRISVVLCTYNGARYVAEQLRSIAAQTTPPDEIVVQDDGSTDSTLEVVRKFAASNTHLNVVIVENADRLGVTRNFEAALRRATGDLLALCDQDDLWLPEKLSILSGLLDRDGDAGGACADASCITADGGPVGATVWGRIGFDERDRRLMSSVGNLGPLVRFNVVPGATLLIRRKYLDLLLPFSDHGYYDHWCALLLQSASRLAFAPSPLQQYRLHEANTVGLDGPGRSIKPPMREWRRATRREQAAFARDALHRLASSRYNLPESTRLTLEGWASQSAFRADLPRSFRRRVGPVARRLVAGAYGRYSNGAARGFVSGVYDVIFG